MKTWSKTMATHRDTGNCSEGKKSFKKQKITKKQVKNWEQQNYLFCDYHKSQGARGGSAPRVNVR